MDYIRVDQQLDHSIMICFIVIVFPDKEISEYIDEVNSNNPYYMESFIKFTDGISTLTRLKEMLGTKKYPITILDISEGEIEIEDAVEYVVRFMRFSNCNQVKFSLQNLVH